MVDAEHPIDRAKLRVVLKALHLRLASLRAQRDMLRRACGGRGD